MADYPTLTGHPKITMQTYPVSFLSRELKPHWVESHVAVLTKAEYNSGPATHTGAAYSQTGALILESLRPAQLGHWRHIDPVSIAVDQYADAPLENVGIFGGHFFNMWGHFLLETITTAVVADKMPENWPVVFAPFDPNEWQSFVAVWDNFKELLAAAGWNDRRLILQTSAMRFNILMVPDRLSVFGLPDGVRAIAPEVANVFRAITAKFGTGTGDRVPMVARRPDWSARIHPSEQQVYALLAARGWRILNVVAMTAVEQAQAFSHASALIGFSGSNMHNSVLCPEGTPVFEIGDLRSYQTSKGINPTQMSLSSMMGQPSFFVDSFELIDADYVPLSAEAIVGNILNAALAALAPKPLG